jgi:hypothetical protein
MARSELALYAAIAFAFILLTVMVLMTRWASRQQGTASGQHQVAQRASERVVTRAPLPLAGETQPVGLGDRHDPDPLPWQQPVDLPMLGIVFDIDKTSNHAESRNYLIGAWTSIWRSVGEADLKRLAGAFLSDGDLDERRCCVAIQFADAPALAAIRDKLFRSPEFREIAAPPMFLEDEEARSLPLMQAGMIDLRGDIIGKTAYCSRPALQALKEPPPPEPSSKAPAEPQLSSLAKQLLSQDKTEREAAMRRTRELAREGKREGLNALEEAFQHRHGRWAKFYRLHSAGAKGHPENALAALESLARQGAIVRRASHSWGLPRRCCVRHARDLRAAGAGARHALPDQDNVFLQGPQRPCERPIKAGCSSRIDSDQG